MSAITISREFGSEGDYIAQQAAQRLGFHFVDKKFIGRILGEYGYVEFDKEYDNLPGFWERFDAQREKQRDVMMKMLDQVVQAVAYHGNVIILGRSGFEVLGKFTDVIHIRIQAPLAVRIGRVMEKQNISFEQAEELVKEKDKVRLAFVEEFYKVPWGAIKAFDVVINTGKVSPDTAVNWISDMMQTNTIQPDTGKPTTDSIMVDHILESTIFEALGCHNPHR
jgi:CMP/dCMP kinase